VDVAVHPTELLLVAYREDRDAERGIANAVELLEVRGDVDAVPAAASYVEQEELTPFDAVHLVESAGDTLVSSDNADDGLAERVKLEERATTSKLILRPPNRSPSPTALAHSSSLRSAPSSSASITPDPPSRSSSQEPRATSRRTCSRSKRSPLFLPQLVEHAVDAIEARVLLTPDVVIRRHPRAMGLSRGHFPGPSAQRWVDRPV